MPKIRHHLSAFLRTALSAGAFFALCCGEAFADRMASDIQEAIYNFEMKGNVNEAVRILEKVSKQGDREDQQEANFFLGKIYELSSSKKNANYYYRQSLRKTKETGKAYWLAARAASTSESPEALLKKSLRVRFPIKKTAVKTVLAGKADDENNYDAQPIAPKKETIKAKKKFDINLEPYSMVMLEYQL